ncbi:vitellogenin [Caerostris extrusa]|uniref:Vitellogenin n=1 Tax=Caerostris extrusa TaxID=172846 RepID=A0AAV4S721_CAEEX|nr:vitellogenin [Caerostris extrusa]
MVKHLAGLKDKFSKLPSWKSLNLKTSTMEKNSESSHSFVFMNTKIVVPSVTGRLYSIDLTGSSTVGLTSRNKFDISSLPQNADINLHLQLRVNVEVSTRVGIQSGNYRPDFKIVSLLYLESNLEVDFKVKDGHIALGRLSVPSENIARVKLIKLNTPLGLSVCAYVEYLINFIQTVYPYVLPYGNVELALKKSDTLNSYDIYLEIPKNSLQEVFHQQTGNMRYKASFDTPGSKTLRRFSVDLELIKRYKSQRINDTTYVSLQIHRRNWKVYQASAELSYKKHHPFEWMVQLQLIKEKNITSVLLSKQNRPQFKPVAFKG